MLGHDEKKTVKKIKDNPRVPPFQMMENNLNESVEKAKCAP
jgi:ribosomal protein L39E